MNKIYGPAANLSENTGEYLASESMTSAQFDFSLLLEFRSFTAIIVYYKNLHHALICPPPPPPIQYDPHTPLLTMQTLGI